MAGVRNSLAAHTTSRRFCRDTQLAHYQWYASVRPTLDGSSPGIERVIRLFPGTHLPRTLGWCRNPEVSASGFLATRPSNSLPAPPSRTTGDGDGVEFLVFSFTAWSPIITEEYRGCLPASAGTAG